MSHSDWQPVFLSVFLIGKLVAIRLLNNYVNHAQVKAEFGSLDSALGAFDKNLSSIFKTEKKLDFPKILKKKEPVTGYLYICAKCHQVLLSQFSPRIVNWIVN